MDALVSLHSCFATLDPEIGVLGYLPKPIRVADLGRGRRHGPKERQHIVSLVEEAVAAGARREEAAPTLGIAARTPQRWAEQGPEGVSIIPFQFGHRMENDRLLADLRIRE